MENLELSTGCFLDFVHCHIELIFGRPRDSQSRLLPIPKRILWILSFNRAEGFAQALLPFPVTDLYYRDFKWRTTKRLVRDDFSCQHISGFCRLRTGIDCINLLFFHSCHALSRFLLRIATILTSFLLPTLLSLKKKITTMARVSHLTQHHHLSLPMFLWKPPSFQVHLVLLHRELSRSTHFPYPLLFRCIAPSSLLPQFRVTPTSPLISYLNDFNIPRKLHQRFVLRVLYPNKLRNMSANAHNISLFSNVLLTRSKNRRNLLHNLFARTYLLRQGTANHQVLIRLTQNVGTPYTLTTVYTPLLRTLSTSPSLPRIMATRISSKSTTHVPRCLRPGLCASHSTTRTTAYSTSNRRRCPHHSGYPYRDNFSSAPLGSFGSGVSSGISFGE